MDSFTFLNNYLDDFFISFTGIQFIVRNYKTCKYGKKYNKNIKRYFKNVQT